MWDNTCTAQVRSELALLTLQNRKKGETKKEARVGRQTPIINLLLWSTKKISGSIRNLQEKAKTTATGF